MRSAAVCRTPAIVTVRITVEPAAENRFVEVVAESPDFYRSSQIELNPVYPVRQSVIEFRNLAPGLYQVTGTLVGVHGRRAAVTRLARVEASVGSR
jgi:hypothetical protein